MFKQGIGWGRGEENGHVCRGRLGSGMLEIAIPLYLMDRIVGLGLLDWKSRCILIFLVVHAWGTLFTLAHYKFIYLNRTM
jgi:hypothetical protein